MRVLLSRLLGWAPARLRELPLPLLLLKLV